MEVLRRLKLPDARSVIPKLGASQNPVKEDKVPARTSTSDENGVESLTESGETDNRQLIPKKARGKQPIAPKPDENIDVMGRKVSQQSKNTRLPSSPTRSRPRASQGRVQRKQGNLRKGAQDPPGNVNRNASIVAAHLNVSALPEPSSPPQTTMANPASKAQRSSRLDHRDPTQSKDQEQEISDSQPQVSSQTHSGGGSPYGPSSLKSETLGDSSAVRSTQVMLRRPTPATYLFQSPSRADTRRAAALVSLYGDEGGVIGELDGPADETPEPEVAVTAEDLPHHQSPRILSIPKTIGESSNDRSSGFPQYLAHDSGTSLNLTTSDIPPSFDDSRSRISSGPAKNADEDDKSLPDQSQCLQVTKDASGVSRPEESTTSLGRHSTTTAAIRRRGRSNSRTRQNCDNATNPLPSTITTTALSNGSPSSPHRRSRSRRRRSQSRSQSRTRSATTTAVADAPDSTTAVAASDATEGNLSPSGRRGRAPPVTKRTHAQKMSMRHAVRAADLDMVPRTAPVDGFDKTLASAAPSSPRSTRSPAPSYPSLVPPSGVEPFRSNDQTCGVGEGLAASPLYLPSSPPFTTGEGEGEGDTDPGPLPPVTADSAIAVPSASTRENPGTKNPVRILAKGLLKRRTGK